MKPPSPKIIGFAFRLVLGLVLLAVGGMVYGALKSTAEQLETADPADRTVHVQVMTAQTVELARQWRGYGTTMAKDTADVPSRVGTTVVDIPEDIEVGRVVTKDQVLATLDPTDFESEFNTITAQIGELDAAAAQIQVDKARLDERIALEEEDRRIAQEEYERQLGYLADGRASQQDVDRTQRAVNAADRALTVTRQALDALGPQRMTLDAQREGLVARQATAQLNVDRCTIYSPMDGILELIDIEEGENITPGQRIARVIDPRRVEVHLQFPASADSDIQAGNAVTITTRNLPFDSPPWETTIARFGGINDTQTRTFTAYAMIDQSGLSLDQLASGGGAHRMQIGAFVASTLVGSDVRDRWVVPARAIRDGRVRLVVNNTITSEAVEVAFEYEGALPQLGLPDTQWLVLRTPLEPGALVVVNASVSVLDGQHVQPVPVGGEDAEAALHDAADDETDATPDAGARP